MSPSGTGPSPNAARGSTIAVGLAAALWMWAIIYISMCPAVAAPPWLAAAIIAVGLFGAGWSVGRWAGAGWAGGLRVGGMTGVLNLLILGSLLGEQQDADAWKRAATSAAIYLVAAMALGAAGAAASGRREPRPVAWTSVTAVVTATAALLLIAAGGIVTGLEAGLAIRGWLTANDYALVLFPLSHMQQDAGVYAEHSHRLWGLFVGLSTILLCVQLWMTERRRWICALATAILLAVIVQGVLGGTRVLEKSIPLAIAHGVFAQIVLGAMVAVAVIASAAFTQPPPSPPDRSKPTTLAVVLLVQLGLGAFYRHVNADPDLPTGLVHGSLGGHIAMVPVVAAVVFVAGGRALKGDDAPIRRVGAFLLVTVLVQIGFGVAALLAVLAQRDADATGLQVAITTAHQTTGAVLLAATAALITLSRRPSSAPA